MKVEGGIVETGTMSAKTAETAILAESSLDLKTLTLASSWTIRALEEGVPEGQQPFVRLAFSGPVTRPERQVDLRPLLDLVQTRRMQHQLDELERLEGEQRAEATGSLPVAAGSQPSATPPGGGPAAEVLPNAAPEPGSVPAGEAASGGAQQAPDLLRRMGPAMRDMLRGG
jgi:hypothetical protein